MKCDSLRSELMHKTKLANDLEEALKKIKENVTDQTNTQEQITDEQNDEAILKVCFVLMHAFIVV